jgi:hypothetical protein
MGKKATGHKKGYYTNQRAVTSRHKSALATKRAKRLQMWISKGVKKNGKKVLTMEERAERKAARKAARATVTVPKHTSRARSTAYNPFANKRKGAQKKFAEGEVDE